MARVLMIRMKKRGRFFTEEANLDMLHEFARAFNAELSLVDATAPYLIPTDKLASLVCEPAADCGPRLKTHLVRRIHPEARRERAALRRNATRIRRYIRGRLLGGEGASLKHLKQRFKGLALTGSCLCNHLTAVRTELRLSGHVVEKTGAGSYCLTG